MLLLMLQTVESEDDRAFLIDLYRQYDRLLLDEANRILRNPHDAEDVVQDFFAYIMGHLETFRAVDGCKMRYYLVLCIRRRCVDAVRKRETIQRHSAGSFDDARLLLDAEAKDDSFEDALIDRLTVEELKSAFLRLPEHLQHILEYKYLLNLSDREITKLIGVKQGSVRAYLTKARRAMYRICKEKGYAKE